MHRGSGADVVVVGAGAAGCVVARRLADVGRRVVLLEAGPDLRFATEPDARDGWNLPTVPDWGYTAGPPRDGGPRKVRRGRLIGGTSWLTRFAVRGSRADFDAWGASGNPGWAFDDVLPAFRRLERDAEFGRAAWHGDAGPVPITRYPDRTRSPIHEAALDALVALGFDPVDDHNAPDAIGVGPMPMSSQDGVRDTTADAYLPREATPPDLVIRPDSEVDRVIVQSGRVTGVRLVDGSVVAAEQVVVAAGTYSSPGILMRSGIGPADHLGSCGIDVVVDLPGVGSNLADHPGTELDSRWRGSAPDPPPLHSIATFRSSLAQTPAPDMMFWLTDPTADEPTFALDPILLKPASRGTVRLTSANPGDPPRITLPSLTETVDVDRLAEGLERAHELAHRPEFRRGSAGEPPAMPPTPEARRRAIVDNAYSIPHVVGTCRMGPSPSDGDVVDSLGAVHGVDGLAVVDASIIPDAPSGFPHVIVIMLAEHLVARWTS